MKNPNNEFITRYIYSLYIYFPASKKEFCFYFNFNPGQGNDQWDSAETCGAVSRLWVELINRMTPPVECPHAAPGDSHSSSWRLTMDKSLPVHPVKTACKQRPPRCTADKADDWWGVRTHVTDGRTTGRETRAYRLTWSSDYRRVESLDTGLEEDNTPGLGGNHLVAVECKRESKKCL